MTDTPESPAAWAREVLEAHWESEVWPGECRKCNYAWPCQLAIGARHVLALTEALGTAKHALGSIAGYEARAIVQIIDAALAGEAQ